MIGSYTTDQYEHANFANGARVVKQNSQAQDATANGTIGTVLGSVGDADIGCFYFIEWDDKPGFAVGCMEAKLGPAP